MKKKRQLIGIITTLIIAVIIIAITFAIGSNDTVATTKKVKEEKTTSAPVTGEIDEDIKEEEIVTNKSEEAVNEEIQKENKVKVDTEKTEDETIVTSSILEKPVTQYVNVSSLNMRSGAGTHYPVVIAVTQGQALIVSEVTDSWSKVKMNDKTGWVYSEYLSETKPVGEKSVVGATPAPSTTTVTKPEKSGNIADTLKTVNGNQQLILVTTNGYNTNRATIQAFEKDESGKWNLFLNTTGYIGKNGFTANKKEGDGKSPVGKYTIGTAFGQKGNPGTKLPFRNITNDDVWVDDPESPLYNSWQSRNATQGQWKNAENMMHRLYTYGFVINYNTERTPYKGSAIFFHVGSGYTLGCTATSEANVIKLLKWLDPAKNPVILQTPVQELNKY
ncbi:hypothetical protein DZB84_12995 [Bacillus sp. HNG]|uniref:SH3 domain-containing protein n=1 Tax=Bacillus sp. HNG TaxID=2293325 RepID=UPI000E2EA90D|nr:SH3 domain-containing protein [Bacillus sp. HNG]RFB15315.1 hypothetical protein DZB84_12995 [Bacillus sp. HNG]